MLLAKPFALRGLRCGATCFFALSIRAVSDAKTSDVCRVDAPWNPAKPFCAVLDADASRSLLRGAAGNGALLPVGVFVAKAVVLGICGAVSELAHSECSVLPTESAGVGVGGAPLGLAEPVCAVTDAQTLRLGVGLAARRDALSVCSVFVAQPSPLRTSETPLVLAHPFRTVPGAEALGGGVGVAAVDHALGGTAVLLAHALELCQRAAPAYRANFHHSAIGHDSVGFCVESCSTFFSSRRRRTPARLLAGLQLGLQRQHGFRLRFGPPCCFSSKRGDFRCALLFVQTGWLRKRIFSRCFFITSPRGRTFRRGGRPRVPAANLARRVFSPELARRHRQEVQCHVPSAERNEEEEEEDEEGAKMCAF